MCDICYDQLERGDPVCLVKQVALLRSESESSWQAGAKTLADWAAMDPQFAAKGIVDALDTLKLPELLPNLLDGTSAATQGAVAKLLAAMLQYEEYRDLLGKVDLLEPLLSALKSSSTETKINAVSTIGTLTLTEPGRANLRRSGGLVALIDVLLSATSEKLQEVTCQVLANMCEDATDDWRQMAENGATFALVGMLQGSNVALQEAALTLLAMLCGHDSCRDQVADAGCMPALCVLLSSSKPSVQAPALALTQELCSSRRACMTLLECGAASPLAAMLGQSSISNTEIAAATLECLQALSQAGLPQTQTAVRNAGVVPSLIQLMSHSSPRVSQPAASLVSLLCPGDVQASEQLFESGGLVMLADELQSGGEHQQLQAVSALAQLSAQPQHAAAIVENGCVNPLLALLEHPNQELKSYAAIAFGNLCSNGALAPTQLQHPSMLPHVVKMLSSTNGLAKAPAAGAIAAMAGQPQLRQSVYQLGGLAPLAALLQSDPDTAYHAVQAVAQFAADERFRPMLPEVGALPGLVSLLASNLPHVQQCALSAVANTSFVPAAAQPLCAHGVLSHIGQLLFAQDEATQTMCLTALCNLLGQSPQSSDALLQVGGHMALLTQLSSPSVEKQSQAAMAVGHMGRHKPALQALMQADAVPLLANLLHSPHPSVQLQAVYALGVLAAEDETAAAAVQQAGAIAPLTTLLLSSASVEVKQHLSLTIAHVARGQWRPVFNVGGFQALLDVLAVGTDAVQQDVIGSVAELMEDVHQRRALLSDMNSISAIVQLLSSPNLKTQASAAAALAALSQEDQAREVLYRLGTLSHVIRSLAASNLRQEPGAPHAAPPDAETAASRVSMVRVVAAFAADKRYSDMLRITIQPLVAMLSTSDPTVIAHAAMALTSLSHSEPNRDALRDAGALQRMASLLLHDDGMVQQCACQAVANLGVDANDAKTFLSSGWHLSLISLLSAQSDDVQAAAAAVLGNLSTSPDFRTAIVADGALQPILQLLHAPALPTSTAAVRALAIMSTQLMSPEVPPGDKASASSALRSTTPRAMALSVTVPAPTPVPSDDRSTMLTRSAASSSSSSSYSASASSTSPSLSAMLAAHTRASARPLSTWHAT